MHFLSSICNLVIVFKVANNRVSRIQIRFHLQITDSLLNVFLSATTSCSNESIISANFGVVKTPTSLSKPRWQMIEAQLKSLQMPHIFAIITNAIAKKIPFREKSLRAVTLDAIFSALQIIS
jgi:hypothetical protein